MGVKIHSVSATATGYKLGPGWKALTYACPSCNGALGVQIDPIAIKTDIVQEVTTELFRRLRTVR
jgi:hypothetical protein